MATRELNYRRGALCMAAAVWAVMATSAYAERPPIEKLLPENTVFVVSIPDAKEMGTRFLNTAIGRMSQDPKVQPLIGKIYGSMSEIVGAMQETIGLSLTEILSIPQGDITIAAVGPSDAVPVFVTLIDAGNQFSNAHKLLEKGLEALERSGSPRREEKVGDVKVWIYDNVGPEQRTVAVCEKESTILAATDMATLKAILGNWDGAKAKTLSENEHFNAVMNRCKGAKDERPQMFWFVDPVNLMRSISRDNVGVALAVSFLPILGLDGLQAAGGTVTFDAGQFDWVMHIHVLLQTPRAGVLKMIALEPGASKPERWMPADVATYTTLHWNFETTLKTLTALFDSIRGEGAFAVMLDRRVTNGTGIVLQKVLPALDGRATYVTWYEKPTTPQSQVTMFAFKIKDAEVINKTIEDVAERFQQYISKQSFGGKTYYRFNIPAPPNAGNAPAMPIPCFGVIDDYLVITNRPSLYEKSVVTLNEGTKSLADELDFKLIQGKISRQSGGQKPVLLSFQRPEEGMRFLYDLAGAEATRNFLSQSGERNRFLKSLGSAMDQNPLPPFSVLESYLAPGGAMVTDDDTGLHFMTFTLKRKSE